MADRYYVSFPLAAGEVLLQGAEAHHLATVIRSRVGDAVTLFDGRGSEFPATISEFSKRRVRLEVGEANLVNRELPFTFELATAVPKGEREDFLIQKLTELGVTRFVPLTTQRSIVVPKPERIRRTVIEACKQCGRNTLMQIGEVQTSLQYFDACPSRCKLIAYPHQNTESLPESAPSELSVAIGPEGGWTDEEVRMAVGAGWRAVSLGQRILRIETAGIAIAAYYSLSAINA